MLTIKLTPKEIEVIKHFANKGPTHGYAFHSRKGVKLLGPATWESVRKKLIALNLIEFKEKAPSQEHKGKMVDLYGLTWKGLLYCLKEVFIRADTAYDTRKKNKLIIPFKEKYQFVSNEDMDAAKDIFKELGISKMVINSPSDNEMKKLVKIVDDLDPDVQTSFFDDIEKILSKNIYNRFLMNVLNESVKSDLGQEFFICLFMEYQLIPPKHYKVLIKKYPFIKTAAKMGIKYRYGLKKIN